MSGGGGGGGSRGNGAAVGPIPAMSRKLVQTVKEIVNCPDSEIYSMLRECNMDPNETVHRLLSQGLVSSFTLSLSLSPLLMRIPLNDWE